MTLEETFGQLLGLGKTWRVVEARLDAQTSRFVLKVEETPDLWPEESAEAVILMREMPVKRAGQILGESESRMWRMLFSNVKAADARLSFENVVWVGADEMNRRKGHNYLTVFADLVQKRVIFATPGKDAEVWRAFAAKLLCHNGHPRAIQHVAIDMSGAYIKGVAENLGNARVVYDNHSSRENNRRRTDERRRSVLPAPTASGSCLPSQRHRAPHELFAKDPPLR